MKLGCMLYSLGRALRDQALTLPQAFALIRECGGAGVDLMESYLEGHDAREVKRMVEDAGLEVSAHIGGANLTTPVPAERAKSLGAIQRVIETAHALSCSNLLVTTGACAEGQDRAAGRKLVADGLAELIPHAKQAGVVMSIEDFGSPRAPYQTGQEVLECCQWAGPEVMITYDSGNMVMGDEDPVEALGIMRPRIVHAHAKDWELLPPDSQNCLVSRSGKKYVGTVVGRGVLDYPAIFAALKAMNYQGYVAFEYEGRGDPVQATREGMAYLRQFFDSRPA